MIIALWLCRAALLIWFFGCIVTYRVGGRTLVDGMGLRSAEFVMLAVYCAGLLAALFFGRVGAFLLLAVLLFWLTVQFFCHWYYTLFGATEAKLRGYNRCFAHTLRLLPSSETRVVPDLYHIVLHTLLLANVALLCVTLFS